MTLCVLYYVEYSLYNVKKLGFFFYLGWNYTLSTSIYKIVILQYIFLRVCQTALELFSVWWKAVGLIISDMTYATGKTHYLPASQSFGISSSI